jgi:hypothetical protein
MGNWQWPMVTRTAVSHEWLRQGTANQHGRSGFVQAPLADGLSDNFTAARSLSASRGHVGQLSGSVALWQLSCPNVFRADPQDSAFQD